MYLRTYIPYHAMPCHAMPCHAMPCHAIPYHTIPYHTIPCHTSVDAGASLGASLLELASEAECVCTASNTQNCAKHGKAKRMMVLHVDLPFTP